MLRDKKMISSTEFVALLKKQKKINWVYIDWNKYARHSERVGLSGKVVPAIAIEEPSSGLHFAYDEAAEISTALVSEWATKFLNKELQATIRSEEPPRSNDGPVKVVVAKTFKDIVLDPTKDVFVEFYAPWCGHCKNLAPIWEQLGEQVKDVASNVVIAKIDATANDVDAKYGIRGFPTLKFFTAGNKETPLEYSGDRSLEDLLEFVKTSATSSHSHDEL